MKINPVPKCIGFMFIYDSGRRAKSRTAVLRAVYGKYFILKLRSIGVAIAWDLAVFQRAPIIS
jgi:hypothetical protein